MSLDNDIRHLGLAPIFTHLDFEARRLLAFTAETKILRAGDALFHRGEASDGGFFVLSGSITLDYSDEDGRSAQIVGVHALIGEISLLVETKRPATAIAREPSSVLKISRTLFRRVLEEYPESAALIRQAIKARLVGFVGELTKFSSASRPQRPRPRS